jgi:hypothetical protein
VELLTQILVGSSLVRPSHYPSLHSWLIASALAWSSLDGNPIQRDTSENRPNYMDTSPDYSLGSSRGTHLPSHQCWRMVYSSIVLGELVNSCLFTVGKAKDSARGWIYTWKSLRSIHLVHQSRTHQTDIPLLFWQCSVWRFRFTNFRGMYPSSWSGRPFGMAMVSCSLTETD